MTNKDSTMYTEKKNLIRSLEITTCVNLELNKMNEYVITKQENMLLPNTIINRDRNSSSNQIRMDTEGSRTSNKNIVVNKLSVKEFNSPVLSGILS